MQEGRRKAEFKSLLMDFLKVLAEEKPAVKEMLRNLTGRRWTGGLFG